jgi:nucleoside 2-deoxyribosyltransferase
MPFEKKFDAVYRKLIGPAVRAQGFVALRADELTGSGFIMEQIRSAIQQARFCIADITRSNPNVLYEVGLAHAAGKPIILLAEEGSHLPFDLAHQRVVFYADDFEKAQNALRGAVSTVTSQDRMPEATRLLDLGLYRASIVAAALTLEQKLRAMLSGKPQELESVRAQRILSVLEGNDAITRAEASKLRKVLELRNRAVHNLKEPSRQDAEFVLATVRTFLDQNS